LADLFNQGLIGLNLSEIAEKVASCERCRLFESRTNTVPGEGDEDSDLVIVGEGPGRQEDKQGRPFVGRAGRKLDDILGSVSIAREEIYITNIVKCRPPENRAPRQDEMESCFPYLEAQLATINPSVVVTLGNSSTQFLLDTNEGITSLRGEFFQWRGDIKLFPMFHPSYLLRNPSRKKGSPKYQTWQDIKTIKNELKNQGS